jgi:hypothetical protein
MGGNIAEGFLYDSVKYIANDSIRPKNTADVAQVVTSRMPLHSISSRIRTHIFGKEHFRRH